MSRFQLINFVKQNDSKSDKTDTHSEELDGNEIKEFYENVISSNDPLNDKIKSDLRKKCVKTTVKRPKPKPEFKQNQNQLKLESIFKFCQNGDLEECLQWLQMGFDINTRDQYLWTPLMCSACAGHENIVRLLLQSKADITAKDKTGRTASDLALISGHQNICQLINDFKNSKTFVKSNKRTKSDGKVEEKGNKQNKNCVVCGYEYKGCDVRHNCSIVHQIHVKNDRKFNKYFEIPERNKGFQMLLRNGWTRDRGLGPDGKGMTAPIKTVLKKDRLGLGNVHSKPKVTHFSAFDETSVKHRIKENKSSKAIKQKQTENRLKRLEIKFRQEFR